MRVGYWIMMALTSASCFAQEPLKLQRATPSGIEQRARRISPEAAATLVVFNNRDAFSVDLAGYYAERRGIPFDHLVGLDCPPNEEITREEYDRTIAEPLRQIFEERGWWNAPRAENLPITANRIRFVALMRGVPLKIRATENYPGDRFEGQAELNKNEAAVDSELAMLGFRSRTISGAASNPYYRSFKPFLDTPLAPLMLVCRLDAPTPKLVRQMIDDCIAAEKSGLWGFAYVDARGISSGGFAEGDRWLNKLAKDAREHGIPVIQDDAEEQFPTDYPMRDTALYFGWYSDKVTGPIARPDFRFNRGAIACHIHSSSAATLRDATQCWAAPLLAHGAAATLGNVYEPYLALTPNLDIFEDRLRNGFNFAESAYTSVRALSWMTTFIGDPLYQPFKIVQDSADSAPATAAEWIAYRDGARLWFRRDRATGEKALSDSAKRLRSGIVFEGLGLLQWSETKDAPAAMASLEQAERAYANASNADDSVRTIIHRVQILKSSGKTKDAIALARRGLAAYPKSPAAKILSAFTITPASSPTPQSQGAR